MKTVCRNALFSFGWIVVFHTLGDCFRFDSFPKLHGKLSALHSSQTDKTTSELHDVDEHALGTSSNPKSKENIFSLSRASATVTSSEEVIGSNDVKENLEKYDYDWREQWYPLGVEKEMLGGTKAPIPVSIFDHDMVLFKDAGGSWSCVKDLCPHRAAKLSQGQVTNGTIECLYHGWKFDGTGACTDIPQLEAGAQIPRAACIKNYPLQVKEGIIFVYMGSEEGAKTTPVPCSKDDLDSNSDALILSDFQIDLPYDHTYLLENLLDPAHIHISHDATPGGGKKEKAGPITFDILGRSEKGFKATQAGFMSPTPSRYDFEAPCMIRSRSEKEGKVFGAALHCIPFGKGRSRLIFRTYMVNPPKILRLMFKLRFKALQYLNSCKILEQDMGLISSQEDYIARTKQPLKDAFIPIKTSDELVVEYRKWLDAVGKGLPFYEGWKTSKLATDLTGHENILSPLHRFWHGIFGIKPQPLESSFSIWNQACGFLWLNLQPHGRSYNDSKFSVHMDSLHSQL